MNLITKI